MAQDIVDDLYDNLKEDGWVENSREHFREFFLAPGEQGYRNRKALYDNMKEDGYVDSPTYEEFARRMGLVAVKKDDPTKQSTARGATEGAAASGGNRTAAEGAGTRRPADAGQSAQGESTQAQQGGWRPTPIQKAFAMGDISDRVNSTIQSLQRGREAIRRVVKAQTPKGRSATKAAEMTARMAGTPTKVLGVSSYSTGDDATDAPAGGRLSPTVHGVKIEDGEAKTEWMLPDGTLTTSIVDADKAEYGARQARLRNQFEARMKKNGLDPTKKEDVEEQTRRDVLDRAEKSVDIRLAENEKNLRETYDKRAEELDREMEWRDSEGFWDNFRRIVGGSVNRSVSNRAPKPVDTRSQHERTAGAYMAERQVLNEAKNLLETRSLKKSHGFMGGFWNVANNWRNFKIGAWHTATDLDFQTGYLMSAEKAGQLLEIEDKLKSGADLTDAEVSLVYSTMLGNEVEANTEIPHGYTAAKITVEMFPFMAQMMLNPASGLSRALVTKFGKSGLRKIAVRKAAQELTGEAAKRFAKRETRKLAAKAVGVQVAGDLAEATVLANTLQLPRTAADITERYVGNPIEDEKGNIIFDGNHNWAEAIYKGEASMIIENYTEMLGEHFGVMGKFIGKGAGKGLRAIGAGKVVDTVSDMITKFRISDFGKALGKLESRAHWNGAPLEVLEEEAGIVLNSIFTGDEKISDLWDADKQIDIILGVGLFGGFVSGIKTAGYPVAKARAKSRLRKRDGIGSFRFGDRWGGMREAMEQADERDLGTVVRDLTRAEAKSQEQARAIVEYARALMSARGYEIASASARAAGRVAPEQQDVEESYEHGSQIVEDGDTQAMGDVRAEMERARRKFVSSTSEDFVADHFDGPDAVSNLSKLGDDAELRQAAADYVNAKAVYDGMTERVSDDIESRMAQSDAEIDSRVNRQTGQIQAGIVLDPETGSERQVYIIDGTVTMLASGAGIDRANSSESIIVRDAETGKVRFAAPSEFVSVRIGIDAEAQKEAARTQIREDMSRTAEDEMAGKLAFTPGDEYSILNLDGSEMRVQVIGPSADGDGHPVAGHVDIMYDGRVARVSTAVLQRWVDDARKARAEEYARERAEEEGGTETGPDNQDNGLDNPNRRTDLMPDDYQTPYDELPVRAARYIESERGTGGTLYRDENGNDAVVIAAIDDDNYVGYFREYDDAGNPTNRWSAKFQNGSGEKENYRDMMRTAGALLPAGHELTEHTSVSTDGLRNLANQLKHGYELQYDGRGNIVTTEVAVNMMAKENALGLDQYIPGSERIIRADLTAEEQAEVRRRLTPYLEALGLSEGNCRWRNNTLYVDHPILKKADPAESEPVPPVSMRYDRGDSFRVAVSGREETQQAAVVDREGETVTIWTPFPVTDKSEKGRTMSGYTTDIARADLDAIIARDEQGNPVDYVAANPEAEENMEGEHTGIENNSVNLQHGNGSEQDNDERTEPREADGGRVASDAAGTVEADRDRSDIRVYEEGLASSRDAHSGDSERNRREAESERLVSIAKANGQYFDRDRKQEFGEKQLKATGESEVFIDRASDKVYKVKDPYAKSPMKGNVQPEDAIYEHLVHNKYFPETRYRFEGISEDLGEARIVLSQGYIESVGRPTQEQIEAALAEKGLYPDGKYTYGNEEVSVTDVTGDNALLGIDGKVYFIDPIINFKKPVRDIIGEYAQASNQSESVPTSVETHQNPTENAVSDGETVPNSAVPVENVQETSASATAQLTPLQRIPRDAKGEPIFEQAENPEHGWDALVEFAEGDAATAKEIADTMAEEKRKAYEKAQKQKPKGKTPAEILASKKAISAGLAQAGQEYNLWQQMANVEQRRQDAMGALQEAEARQRAAERAEAERKRKAAEEEAERKKRELLKGVPEWLHDTPADARARGFRRDGPEKVDRQGEIEAVEGKEVEVKFGKDEMPKGRVAVIEASHLQPSHIQGRRNPYHFIDEAQPKERTDKASVLASQKMAANIRPEEITSSVTAYTGAPTVNRRGETIQGNSRSDALRYMYESEPEQAKKYRQYLMDHAEEFGVEAADIERMEHPVVVNMLDVSDEEAIRLGQYEASDTESGGVERIKAKNAVQKMGARMRSFANVLLQTHDEEASLSQLIERNGVEALKWMADNGIITETQYQSAFDSRGNLSGKGAEDLRGILFQSVFRGGSTRLEELFESLPAKAQRAILSTSFRDYDSPEGERMIEEVQQSVMAYHDMMQYEAFATAGNVGAAVAAADAWARQYVIDDAGEMVLPSEKFSNFAVRLASLYRGGTQSFIQKTLNDLYDAVQGTGGGTLFDAGPSEPMTLAEAIKKVLGIEYEPKNRKENGENGGMALGERDSGGESGRPRGPGDAGGGERGEEKPRGAERGRGAAGDGRGRGEEGELDSDRRIAERHAEIERHLGKRYSFSQEEANHGEVFYQNEEGSTNLTVIPDEIFDRIGVDPMPFKLTETMAWHVYTRHAEELGLKNLDDAIDFVLDIVNSVDHVRLGKGNTFIFSVENTRKGIAHRAVTIVVKADTGEFMGIKTSGFDRISSLEKRPILWESGAVSTPEAVATPTVTTIKAQQGDKRMGSAEGQSLGEKSVSASSSDIETEPEGKRNDTATPQNGLVDSKLQTAASQPHGLASDHKVNNSASEKQGKGEESSDETSAAASAQSETSAQSGTSAAAPARKGSAGGDSARRRVPEGMSREEFDESVRGWKKNLTEASDEELREIVDKWERIFDDEDIDRFGATYVKTVAAEELLEERRSASSGRGGAEAGEAPEGYDLDVYETKKGKKFHRVKFPRADKEVWKERLDIAKEQFGGTSVPGGYGFKDAETAKAFAETILHPVSAEGLKERTDGLRAEALTQNQEAEDFPSTGDSGRKENEYASAGESARKESNDAADAEALNQKARKARSRWFNEEDQDEAAELIRKMKARLKGGSLYGGVPIDVELLELGCRLGYLIMKKGARKLHEYAQAMIENVGDGIRPYIKQLYNATLATEEALAGEWYKDATPMAEIAKFDMVNFLKEQKSDIVETARGITAEQEVLGAMPQAATDMVKKSRDKMAIPGYFKPDGSVSAETKAAEAGADLAASLVEELGLDQKNLPEGVQLITTDFKESGGNIRINLPIRAGYEPLRIDIDFDKTEEGALRLRELTTTMKRGDDLSYIIGEDHKGWLAAPGHKELLNAIRGQIKDYLPKGKSEGKKQAAQVSLFDEAEAPAAPSAPEPQAKTGDKLLMQYETMKKKHPDAVVLFRVGDFYETFRDDARIISETLGLTLTSRGVDKTPLAGFPHHALDAYLPKLVRAGKRVAICEQLEEPKISKQTEKRGTTPQPATEPKAPATSQAEFDELSKKEFEVDPKVEKEIIADRNGFKIGDTVEWSIPGQGKTSATIIDVDSDGRPILDTGMAPIISSIAEWKDLAHKDGEGSQAPAPQRPKSELAGDSAKEQERRNVEHDFVEAVSNELIQRINNEGSPLTMAEVSKMAEERGMKDVSPTDLQELVERAVSLRARSIAEHTLTGGPGTQEIGFNKIVKLYTTQPVLSDRDVERIQRQQYSTPVPMGYVMDQFMMSHGHNGKRLLEPSAGNGALTIGVPKENCHVNDIDPRRLANLRAMGFKVITNQDGLLPFEGRYDMVVTNPPFGTAPSPRTYDGLFEITTLEGQMAINALESMTDDGRAAIIVGGSIGKWPTPYEKNGRLQKVADRQFFGYLYSHYNVVDIIPIDGKSLYSRNGTGYNVRMILIDGRRRDAEGNVIREINAENRVYPPVREEARPEAVTTYDELYKRVQDDILRIQRRLDVADSDDGGYREGNGAVDTRYSSLADRAGSGNGERSVGTGDSGRTPRSGLGGDATRSTSAQGGIHGRPGRDRGVGGQTDADAGSGNGSALDERSGTGRRQTELRAVEHVDGSGDRGGIRHGATDADGGSQRDNADGARQRSGSGPVRLNQSKAVKVELTDEKVASPHISSAGNLMSRMPAAQAQEFERALHELEGKHGNVDEWLTQELGYADTADLYRALAAEQVEGVAMAIDKMNSGRGFIIADQTGIGKGRQAASIIRYAVRNGHKPIFFTQKAGLFSDMYRDLKDIGSPELKPFIFGSDKDEASITERQDDGTDKVIYPLPKPKERDRVLSYIERHGTLPDEYDYAVITYSQVQSGTTQYEIGNNGKIEAKPKTKKGKGASSGEINGERRRNAIGILSRDNYLILDEAHTAGGQSGLGGYMQSIIPGVKGITYLSATYAKRPDNMPLYAIKTAISDSGVEVAELISAVAQGGVPLQEIMSRQLVKSGEMARRERDFTGVAIDWIPSDEGVARGQQKRFDTVSEIFVDIMRFQDTYVRPYLSEMSKDLARLGSSSSQKKGTKDMGIANAPFASKLYNLLQQLLFSIKVDAVADRAIRNLQQGRKPIISFVNTMEGFLEDASMGMTAEGSASMPTLSLALRKALDGVMRYTVKDDNNKETHSELGVSQLGSDAESAYNAIIEKMNAVSDDLPIAPLDAIRMKIEAAGYKVGELSGRKLELAKNDKGLYVIRNRKAADKKATASDFNAGKIDVLMVNKTGSTGISLHASSKFEDQRQRVMIAAQFQPDVNDEVQMRGRNDRTGQIVRGAYEYLLSSIPAEQRLQMMFKAKLKSLDANTTSSQKSSFNEMEVVDVLNKYGDAIVWDYLNEDPLGLNMDMGNPLGIDPTEDIEAQQKAPKKKSNKNDEDDGSHSGFARKALGRLALLPIAEQERVMSEITERYEKKIHELDERGENDLEISYRDLKAKTLGRKVWVEGKDPDSGNAFTDNVYMEQVEVNILDKPLSGTELAKYHRTFLEDAGVETWDEWIEKKTAEIDAFYENRIATVSERITANKEATIARRIERFITTAKDARALGKNSFTDEEITAEANRRYGETERQEAKAEIERETEKIRIQQNLIKGRVTQFKPMSPLSIPDDLTDESIMNLEPSTGVMVGIKLDSKYSLNGSQVVFAPLDGRRTITLSLKEAGVAFSKIGQASMMMRDVLRNFDLSQWDSHISNESRETRYMLTGNILRALVDMQKTQNARGRITAYTTEDGEVRTGILMSPKFTPGDLQSSAPLSSMLSRIQTGQEVKSSNGEVTVRKTQSWSSRGDYEILVPKSKQRGGKYFLPEQDPVLARYVAGGFEMPRSGSQAIGYIRAENLARVLDHLSTKHGASVMLTSVLKEASQNNIEYRTAEEGVEYVNARAIQPWSARLDELRFKRDELGGTLSLWERQEVRELGAQEKVWEEKWAAEHTDTDVPTGRRSRFEFYADQYGQGGLSAEMSHARSESGPLRSAEGRLISANARDMARRALPIIARRRAELLAERPTYSRAGQAAIDAELADLEYMALYYQRMEAGEDVERTMPGRLEHQRMLDTARRVAESLGEKVVLYEAPGDIHDSDYNRQVRKQRSYGWYNPNDGTIHINVGRHRSAQEIVKTVLHEIVGHKTIEQIMGPERFARMIDEIWEHAGKKVRAKIAEKMRKNGWDFREATKEYLAELAEEVHTKGFETLETEKRTIWQRVKAKIEDFLNRILEGMKIPARVRLTENDLSYMMWKVYKHKRRKAAGVSSASASARYEREGDIFDKAEEIARREQWEREGESLEIAAREGGDNKTMAERAREVMEQEAIEIAPHDYSKEELKNIYSNLPAVEKDGRMIEFYHSAFGKNYRPDGTFAKIIPSLDAILESSKFAYSEMERGGGEVRRDGSTHKRHSDIVSRDNYVGKALIQGEEFFVRFNVQNKKKESGVHSTMVTSVDVYENTSTTEAIPTIHGGNLDYRGITDAKLREFFESAKKYPDYVKDLLPSDMGNANTEYRVRENQARAFEPEEGLHFRDGDFTARDRVTAAEVYERMLSRGSWQFREAMQDSMLGLKTLYESILGKGSRIEDVAAYENAYLYENRMSSANNAEQHEYFSRYMKPLLGAIHDLCGSDAAERRELTDYMMAKHGLERNAYMRAEAGAAGEETERDFAGLCGLTGEDDWQEAERVAREMADIYEMTHDPGLVDELWDRTRAATGATLEKIYTSGLISEETYGKVSGMYENYVPLRGWDETTSDEVYGYLTSNDGPLLGNVFKHAEGRESKADDPIATIAKMADDAIRQGNRNVMKQRFLNFVQGHPSDLVSVSDLWLERDAVTGEWKPVFADLEADMTHAEIEAELAKFEARMEMLSAADPENYKHGREARHIPYKVVRGNEREHQILVKRDGRTKVITINGNPRAAQALNGLSNPDVEAGSFVGKLLKAGEWTNRQLSAFYTTRNPDFVVSNFMRDMLYSNTMTWVKESPAYALRYHRNFGRLNPARMHILLRKWENGSLSDANPQERMFREFMRNGGETGYTSVKDIEGHKRAVAAELKKQGSVGRRAWAALGMQLDLLNRSVENCARFAAYVTSREFGRGIDRSIYDAKEISVNFNKKGSGGKFLDTTGQKWLGKVGAHLGGWGRVLYVFWNAGLQGLTNFGRAAKRHPGKALAGAAALFGLGVVIPLLAQMAGGDDDDKNAYYNLPEYIRRSNICFRAGEQWIVIPLPIEYRALYGLGELSTGVISGNERYGDGELGLQMAAQVSQILPLDMLEGGGGLSPLLPSMVKPGVEAYVMNKGWTGLPIYKDTPFNKNDPEWTKAYRSADQHLVGFARWLNETTGGDDYKKGAIDINPAKVEYLLSGMFGGFVSFPMKIKKSGEMLAGDREFEWRNIPLANRIVKSGDERTASRRLQNEYFRLKEEAEETGRLARKYRSAVKDGRSEYAVKVNDLVGTEEYLRYEIYKMYEPDLSVLRERQKSETNTKMQESTEAELNSVMRETVEAMRAPERHKEEVRVNMRLEAYETEWSETGKRLEALNDMPGDAVAKAGKARAINESPEGERYWLYKDLHPYLGQIRKSRRQAETREEREAETATETTLKRDLVEMLDSWNNPERRNAARKRAQETFDAWKRRDSKHIKQ